MSVLGDQIIKDGPFIAGDALPDWMGTRGAPVAPTEWNALRDELIELRAQAARMCGCGAGTERPDDEHDVIACPIGRAQYERDHPDVEANAAGYSVMRARNGVVTQHHTATSSGAPLIVGRGPIEYDEIQLSVEEPFDVRDVYRWKPGEWRGIAPDIAPPCATCGLPLATAAVESRRCACVIDPPPVPGGLRRCPVCRDVLIGPTLVECTACASAEDAAAKRAGDR